MDTEVNSMNCPRCGAAGFCGVCNECGFPVTRVKQINIKVPCSVRMIRKITMRKEWDKK